MSQPSYAPTLPAALPVPPKPSRSLEEIAVLLDDRHLSFRRAVAAVVHMLDVAATISGQVPEGTRVRGVPLLASTSSLGGKSVEVTYNLVELNPQHLGYVVYPLLSLKHGELLDLVADMQSLLEETTATLAKLVQPAPA